MVSAGAGPSRRPRFRRDRGGPASSLEAQSPVESDAADLALPVRIFLANVQHPEVAKEKGKKEDAFVAIASDMYIAPVGNGDWNPKTMEDFNDSRCTRVALERLAKNSSEDEVKDAVSDLDEPGLWGIRLRHSGKHRQTILRGWRKADRSRDYIFLLPERKDAEELLSFLRLAIMPWDQVEDSLVKACVNPSRITQHCVAQTASNRHELDGEEQQNTAERLYELVTSTGTISSGLGTVVKSAMAFAQGADTADEIARLFAGLELVGPVFQIIALVARGAGMAARASANRVEASRLHSNLRNAGQECFEILCCALKRGLSGKTLTDMFVTLEKCWNVAQAAERLMMSSLRDAIGKDQLMNSIVDGLKSIEQGLRDMHVTTYVQDVEEASGIQIGRLEGEMSRMGEQLADTDDQARGNTSEIASLRRRISGIGLQRDDSFKKSTLSVPSRKRLAFVVESAIPQLIALKQDVLAENGPVVFALGHGGVGKTTACITVCHDEDVVKRFSDGIHFLEFSLEANDGEVVQLLCDAIRRAGGERLACRLEQRYNSFAGGGDPIKDVVIEASGWFQNRAVLFVLDNVCPRRIEKSNLRCEWAQLLVDIIANAPGSQVLLTSKFPRLFSPLFVKVEFEELKISNETDFESAVCLIEKYAGSPAASDSVASRNYLVDKCKGLQLLLCVAGRMVQHNDGDWVPTARFVKQNVLIEENVFSVADHPGLVAIMSSCLDILDNDTVRSGTFLGHKPKDLRRFVGESFRGMYARFALLKSARSVPVPLLRSLFGTEKQSVATAVVRCFASVGLAEIRKENGRDFVELHDSQHAFARMMSPGKEEMARQHWHLIDHYARSCARIQDFEWWKLCRTDLPSDVYMAENLVQYLVSAIKPFIEEMTTGCEVHFSQRAQRVLVSLLTDFNWIRIRAFGYGRRAIEGDFRLALEINDHAEDEALAPADGEIGTGEELHGHGTQHAKRILKGGERAAIEAVLKVLDVTHAESFDVRDGPCESHLLQGGTLATEMLGRLGDVSFGGTSLAAIQQAEELVHRLTNSIKDSVTGPWIQPILGMYESGFESLGGVNRQFRPSGGAVNGAAFLSCGRKLVTRNGEGFLSLYDVHDGHNKLARSNFKVDIAGGIAVAPDGIAGTRDIILCDNVSSVSVVVVSNGRKFNDQLLLETGLYGEKETEWLRDVDASRGAKIIAAVGTRYLHIWKQDDAINYGIFSTSLCFLPPVVVEGPHEAFKSVKVSKDGAFIVTASRCSLVICVWRLPRNDKSNVPELLHKVQCSQVHLRKDSDNLTGIVQCLALSDDSTTAFVATRMHSGLFIHRIDLPKGRVTATLKRNGTCHLSTLVVLDDDGNVESSALLASPKTGRIEWWRLSEFSQETENGHGLSTFTVELNSYSRLCVRRRHYVDGNPNVAVDVVWGNGDGTVGLHSNNQFCTNGTRRDADSEDVYVFRRDCNRTLDATCIAPSLWRGLVVVGTECGDIRCHAPETGQEVDNLHGHRDSVLALDVSKDGAFLASGSADNTVRIWEAVGLPKDSHDDPKEQSRTDFVFSKRLVGQVSNMVLGEHKAPVTCVLFSSSGSLLVSGDRSGRVVGFSVLSRTKLFVLFDRFESSAISSLGIGRVTQGVSAAPPTMQQDSRRYVKGYTRKQRRVTQGGSAAPPTMQQDSRPYVKGYARRQRRVTQGGSAAPPTMHIACKTKERSYALWQVGDYGGYDVRRCANQVVVEDSLQLSSALNLQIGEVGDEGRETWVESSKYTTASYCEFPEDSKEREIKVVGSGGTLRAVSCCHFFRCHCNDIFANFDGAVKEHSVILFNVFSGAESQVGGAFLCSRDTLGQASKLGLFHISY